MSLIKTLNQERASFVLGKVKKVKDKDKYKRNARKLPSLITSNGLILTLAFFKSKEETKPVYDTVNEWLKKKGYIRDDALEELINSDFLKLRLATIEILEFANWLKRIVEIEL
ncbi:MAG: type III-B CRISPR module-associated protein Cmr5 [Candidatus Hydrothermales bacterium]